MKLSSLLAAFHLLSVLRLGVEAVAVKDQQRLFLPKFPHSGQAALLEKHATEEMDEVTPEQETAESQAPPAEQVRLGADGFPKLPEVSAMLGTASQTIKSLADQATELQQRIAASQRERASKMGRQKAVMEKKLAAQETENRALVSANAQVDKEIAALKEGNSAIRKHAHELQDSNHLMGEELQGLVKRLGAAEVFAKKALASTDDSHATDLLVLLPEQQQQQQQHQQLAEVPPVERDAGGVAQRGTAAVASLKAASSGGEGRGVAKGNAGEQGEEDSEEDDDSTSLLAVAERHTRQPVAGAGNDEEEARSRDLSQVLQKSVVSIAQEEKASEKQLKSLFVAQFKVGAGHRAKLLEEQRSLNATRASLTALQGQLHVAETHLQGTKHQLEGKLHDLGMFTQKLAHLALAPPAEAPRLLQTLPVLVATASMVGASSSVSTSAL